MGTEEQFKESSFNGHNFEGSGIRSEYIRGKWQNRITRQGWYLIRHAGHAEDFIFRIAYCKIIGSGRERHVDICHEAYGCKRVKLDADLELLRVIYIDIEKALQ